MASYDLLNAALKNAMEYNEKPTQYVDIFGGYLGGIERGRVDKQNERVSDMRDELESSLSGMEDPDENEILDASFKVKTKYGDADGAQKILEYKRTQKDQEAQAQEKQSEKLTKQLKEVAALAQINPELARQARDSLGVSSFSDGMIDGINAEDRRKSRGNGEGGSGRVSMATWRNAQGDIVRFNQNDPSEFAKYKAAGYSPGGANSSAELLQSLLGLEPPEPGKDIDNNEDSDLPLPSSNQPKPKPSMSPQPAEKEQPKRKPKPGMKWVWNPDGSLAEVAR